MAGPLASPEPWNLVSSAYDELIVPVFAHFSRRAIELLGLDGGARVLDCACGPGTASELLARQGHDVDAIDFSEAMIGRLKTKLEDEALRRSIRPLVMDGQALTFKDATFDGALSMFGLMFFPERDRGFRELHRVLKSGGRACVASWLPLSKVPAMEWGFSGFSLIAPAPKDAPPREPVLEDPDVFAKEMEAAGFRNVRVVQHSAPFPITNVEEFWDGMVRSSAPIALFRKRVGEEKWAELSPIALKHLRDTAPPDLGALRLEAWLGVGEKG